MHIALPGRVCLTDTKAKISFHGSLGLEFPYIWSIEITNHIRKSANF